MTVLLALNLHSLASKFGDAGEGQATISPASAPEKKESGEVKSSNQAEDVKSNATTASQTTEASAKLTQRQKLNMLEGWQAYDAASKPSDHADGGPGSSPADAEDIMETDPRVKTAAQDIMGDIKSHQPQIESQNKVYEAQQENLETERRALDQQIQNLKNSEADLDAKRTEQKKAFETEVDRLARVYEQMPPKDAAVVFNILDMHVMVPVALHMNPRKASAIIGNMYPDRANILSQYMAGIRTISSPEPGKEYQSEMATIGGLIASEGKAGREAGNDMQTFSQKQDSPPWQADAFKSSRQ